VDNGRNGSWDRTSITTFLLLSFATAPSAAPLSLNLPATSGVCQRVTLRVYFLSHRKSRKLVRVRPTCRLLQVNTKNVYVPGRVAVVPRTADFCRAIISCKRGLCRHAVSGIICMSVTFTNSAKTNNYIFQFFHRVAIPFWFFIANVMAIFRRRRPP